MQVVNFIKSQTSLPSQSVENTIQLLNEDCTIPFISRYRKELTGNLDEVQIGEIVKYKTLFEDIEKRKATIIKSLQEQEVLTTQLQQKIEATFNLTALEDIYLPYKKKRKTKAETARKNGLEPLAKIIMSQKATNIESIALKYTNNEIKNTEEALEGARYIIAEWINERADIRNSIRYQLEKFAIIQTNVVKATENDEKAQKFRDYFNWSESLNRCPSHRLLAILRAEKEGFIRLKIEIDNERAITKIETKVIRLVNESSKQIQLAIKDAYKRLLLPSLTNEIVNLAKEKADDNAIQVFAKILKQLLISIKIGII